MEYNLYNRTTNLCDVFLMQVTILAKKSVCSYLSLLVNSKDDLALAHILNVPDRGLGREAFTNLKHASQERKMSIFLVCVSNETSWRSMK